MGSGFGKNDRENKILGGEYLNSGVYSSPILDCCEEIKGVVNFSGKRVLDIGCGSIGCSLVPLFKNSFRVVAIESDPISIQEYRAVLKENEMYPEVCECSVEDYYPDTQYDILICVSDLQPIYNRYNHYRRLLRSVDGEVIVIYRLSEQILSKEEMERLNESLGFRKIYIKEVTESDDKIILSVFQRYKKIQINIESVDKIDLSLDEKWGKKLENILHHLKNSVFLKYIYQQKKMVGYSTTFINGKDLHGDFPFHPSSGVDNYIRLSVLQRKNVMELLLSNVKAGIVTGYFLGDFTKRNVILKDDDAYLIDYNDVVPSKRGVVSKDYTTLLQLFLNYLDLNYTFDGDLYKLEKRLSEEL